MIGQQRLIVRVSFIASLSRFRYTMPMLRGTLDAPRSGGGSKLAIQAVAFDLDGTLYPNYRLYIRLIPFILREWRLLWAFGRARSIIRAVQNRRDLPRPAEDFYDYQARLTADMLRADPAFIRKKTDLLIYRGWEPHFTRIKLFSHAAQTLYALRAAGLKLGLLSDFPPEAKLQYLGISGLWDTALCSERIGALKPHPRPFQELAAALDCAPERILYVGNSRRYDVAGARQAGMRAALVTGPLSRGIAAKKDNSPDFIFNDYRQLREFVLN